MLRVSNYSVLLCAWRTADPDATELHRQSAASPPNFDPSPTVYVVEACLWKVHVWHDANPPDVLNVLFYRVLQAVTLTTVTMAIGIAFPTMSFNIKMK